MRAWSKVRLVLCLCCKCVAILPCHVPRQASSGCGSGPGVACSLCVGLRHPAVLRTLRSRVGIFTRNTMPGCTRLSAFSCFAAPAEAIRSVRSETCIHAHPPVGHRRRAGGADTQQSSFEVMSHAELGFLRWSVCCGSRAELRTRAFICICRHVS